MTGSSSDAPRSARTPDPGDERPAEEPAGTSDPAVPPSGDATPLAQASTPPEPEPEPEPEVRVADVVDRSTVRRAPRYGRFIVAGVVLGAVAAFLLAFLSPPSQYARSDLFWILFLGLGFFLGIVGAALAIVLDRRSLARRDARTAGRRTPPAS